MGPMDEAMLYIGILVSGGILAWLFFEAWGHLYFRGDWEQIKDYARQVADQRRRRKRMARRLRARH